MDFKTIISILFTGKGIIEDKNTKLKTTYTYDMLSDSDKESNFFIVNRYLSKKYPAQAQYFNKYTQDKATAMDIWNLIIKKEKNIPFWFWKGATKIKEPQIKDWKIVYELLQDEFSIKDMILLCELFPDEVKDEIKYQIELKKERER